MRLTGGSARGKVLLSPRGQATRPTDSKTREKLFNILAPQIAGARFLDIYAGSGAVGLEALSRGAESCIFIEKNRRTANLIRNNLKICQWSDKGEVWPLPAQAALRKLATQERRFDLIFIDPPFRVEREWKFFHIIIDNALALLDNITRGSRPSLVVQHPHRMVLEIPQIARISSARRAGASDISFIEVK